MRNYRTIGRWLVLLGVITVLVAGCMPAGAVTNPGWTALTAKDRIVYAALAMGQVVALDNAEGGAEVWVYPAAAAGGGPGCGLVRSPGETPDRPLDAVYGPPVVTDGLLLVTSYDHHLYAFDRATGERLWEYSAKEPIIGSVTLYDDIAYFGSSDHGVYALDLETRELVWKSPFYTANWVWGAPAVDAERVYVGSMDHYLYALDRLTGELVWKTDVGGSIVGSVTLADGVLFVGGVDKRLHALDKETGQELWKTPEYRGWVWGEALVDGEYVYFGSLEGSIHALAIRDGSPRWEAVGLDGAVRAGPARYGTGLLVGTDTGKLYAIDMATGDKVLRFEAKGAILSTPVVEGDIAYVGTAAGNIYALDLSRRGDPQLWVYPPPKK